MVLCQTYPHPSLPPHKGEGSLAGGSEDITP